MTTESLFLAKSDGSFLPTQAAIGAWDPQSLHGAAVASLLAGRLVTPGRTLARLTVDLLASVPNAVLTVELGEVADDEPNVAERRCHATAGRWRSLAP
jgi:hypothetical protein